MHYIPGFLNGNTNPLCQKGHFPPYKTHFDSISSHYASTLIEIATIFGPCCCSVICICDIAKADVWSEMYCPPEIICHTIYCNNSVDKLNLLHGISDCLVQINKCCNVSYTYLYYCPFSSTWIQKNTDIMPIMSRYSMLLLPGGGTNTIKH